MHFSGAPEDFIACFEKHALLAKTNGVTSYRRDVTKPAGRIRLVQTRGFVRLAESRAVFLDPEATGYTVVDSYYESHGDKSKPLRKRDWITAWRCGTGKL